MIGSNVKTNSDLNFPAKTDTQIVPLENFYLQNKIIVLSKKKEVHLRGRLCGKIQKKI